MTDDKRELAEYVARWAGYDLRACDSCCPFGAGPIKCWLFKDGTHAPRGFPEIVLTDAALAFRALEELYKREAWGGATYFSFDDNWGAESLHREEPYCREHAATTLAGVIFMAHRSVFGGDDV